MPLSKTIIRTKLTTTKSWDDLALDQSTKKEIDHIITWGTLKKFAGRNGSGCRVLFFNQVPEQSVLAAALIGRELKLPVYRIDLSMVVSKYIGETEKSLEIIFSKADSKSWILFFDEADALFAKRSEIRSAHDRYTNTEVSYLLQRMENYNGITILATSMKAKPDPAFLRRFSAVIHFPVGR